METLQKVVQHFELEMAEKYLVSNLAENGTPFTHDELKKAYSELREFKKEPVVGSSKPAEGLGLWH